MIYLAPNVFPNPEKPEELRDALQIAIEIELAAIPVYLYALYSLRPGTNCFLAGCIESVVKQEMLHVVLDCNLLNAIGGSPVLNDPDRVQKYPGRFQGGVAPGPVLRLAPFSYCLLEKVFLPIEQPEEPPKNPDDQPHTVGAFYDTIRKCLRMNAANLFPSSEACRRRQIKEGIDGVKVVSNLATALDVIDEIVSQGEGSSGSPLGSDGQLAHFFRFNQILVKRRYVPDPNDPTGQTYCYCGDEIKFDEAGVLAVPADPKAENYPIGSSSRQACDSFNETFTKLLESLHWMVNGEPVRFKDAFGLMFSLRRQALDMMNGTSTGGNPAGPSFEYFRPSQ